MAENSHWRRLVYLRKDRVYPDTYDARSILSGMLENLSQLQVVELIYDELGLKRDVSTLFMLSSNLITSGNPSFHPRIARAAAQAESEEIDTEAKSQVQIPPKGTFIGENQKES